MNEEQSPIVEVEELPLAPIYPETMTIYYRKKTGEIKMMMSDTCDMSVFGEEQEDYELIWDFTVVELDDYVRNNRQLFSVDLETKELIFVPSVVTTKYKTKE
jgi:hypothetical protein